MHKRTIYKKAVILGAGGFIGINLATELSLRGIDTICFDRDICSYWPASSIPITGDFGRMPKELLREMDNSVVFHLISCCRPSLSTTNAADEVSHDLVTTIRYLEFTKTRNLRWVFLSSGGTVYGHSHFETIRETCPTHPICSYGAIKIAIEQFFQLYRTLYNIDFVIVRPSNPYGPFQDSRKGQGLIAAILHKAVSGEQIDIWGDGENVRDYIYVTDAVHGILAAAFMGKPGEAYNIGSSNGISVNQLIEQISKTIKLPLLINYSEPRKVDVRRNVLSIKKISEHTGWKPLTSLSTGLSLTFSWLNQMQVGLSSVSSDRCS